MLDDEKDLVRYLIALGYDVTAVEWYYPPVVDDFRNWKKIRLDVSCSIVRGPERHRFQFGSKGLYAGEKPADPLFWHMRADVAEQATETRMGLIGEAEDDVP